ncbi:uncharacterized protein PAC_14391 [Phialocephala subalpina]|uniref:Uncharacterized protein n=1 Tax=Phialocephala subalpina TaxID=576137 RepID=A0A1L7XHG8_9HELO|nr:uncharacterized protein PAC_14391 [Phialocephala subalpina]
MIRSFLRHGDVSNVTAWCSMGDIKLTGGGPIYLENSKSIGQEIEAEFVRKAEEAGFTDEEAKNAFNSNMMATGLLSDSPSEFAKEFNRRWLVSSFEAGDVVLHDAFARWCNIYRVGDGV